MAKCPDCGYCGGCGGGKRGGGPPPDDAAADRGFQIISKNVRVVSDGAGDTSSDNVVISVAAAAAVDVFIRYRNPSTNDTTNPAGTEQWKVWAVTQNLRSQIGPPKASTEAASTSPPSAGQDSIPLFRIAAIRDVPAEAFDITLNTLGVAVGTALFFDVVVIAWGKEPTGIGPMAASTILEEQAYGAVGSSPRANGLVVMGKAAGLWLSLSMNQRTFVDLTDRIGWLDVLAGGVHNTTLPTVTDGKLGPFQLDERGRLIVRVDSTVDAPAVTGATSAAYESSRVASAAAATLYRVNVSSKAAAAGFIFIWNRSALPVDGTLPDFPPIPIAIGNAGGSFVSVDLSGAPRTHSTGIVVAFSSTAATFTLGTADCWFDVGYL